MSLVDEKFLNLNCRLTHNDGEMHASFSWLVLLIILSDLVCVKPCPFLHDQGCYHQFLDEKMNYKSNGIDLTAIEAHLIHNQARKCLEIYDITILG